MKYFSQLLLLSLFATLSFSLHAIELKDGYWIGIGFSKENQFQKNSKLEEWYFDGNKFSIQKFNSRQELSHFQIIGIYEFNNGKMILSNDSDESLILNIEYYEDFISLYNPLNQMYTYLYYHHKNEKVTISKLPFPVESNIYKVSEPELLYKSNEIEFWRYASFFNSSNEATCHHPYTTFQIDDRGFIFFDNLFPIIITSHNENQLSCTSINEAEKPFVLTKVNKKEAFEIADLEGLWNWRTSESLPKKSNSTYTIHIGYDMHKLQIFNQQIDWKTHLYNKEIQTGKLTKFVKNENYKYSKPMLPRKENSIEISPSNRLISLLSFDSYDDSVNNNDLAFAKEIILQYIDKSSSQIILRFPEASSSMSTYQFPGSMYVSMSKLD